MARRKPIGEWRPKSKRGEKPRGHQAAKKSTNCQEGTEQRGRTLGDQEDTEQLEGHQVMRRARNSQDIAEWAEGRGEN